MLELKDEDFNCIKEDNSDEENEKQWKITKKVLDNFSEYLESKKLHKKTAVRYVNMMVYFIMDYLFVYDDACSIFEITDDTIKRFLGNWYIRKNWSPNIKEINKFLISIKHFFTFLHTHNFITKEALDEIKAVCKNKEWFEMRLTTYFKSKDDDFYEWLQDYNYDAI
ncbi:MAG: hypothetical protein J7K40_02255 [candidate division Zixibacteria bacterium]|nr:hypothetical protein [candidate division Zixibacteria bacterium]